MASRQLDRLEVEDFYTALVRVYGEATLIEKTDLDLEVCRELLLKLHSNGVFRGFDEHFDTITLGIQLLTILRNLARHPVLEEAWVGKGDAAPPPSNQVVQGFRERLERLVPNRQQAQLFHFETRLSIKAVWEILGKTRDMDVIKGSFIHELLEEMCEFLRALQSRIVPEGRNILII